MPRTTKSSVRPSQTRRHFLGVVAAASTRLAAMGILASSTISSSAHAKNDNGKHLGWEKGVGNPHRSSGGPHCFLRGTAILTPSGEIPIEELRAGDLVQTASGRSAPVRWIGRQVYRKSGSSWPESVMPIRIAQGALDEHTPHADLYLSPMHALLLEGVLIPAGELVNGTSIAPALPNGREEIEYFHIMLDAHEVVLAEGAPAETFRSGVYDHENFTNFNEYERLFPDKPWPVMAPFAPIVGYGGREHLKALLRLGVSRFIHVRDPLRDAYDRLDARAEELAH